jgi:hypothetical protein
MGFNSGLKGLRHLTLMLACCFYVCETWFLTIREEHRLRVFENRVHRKKFSPERDGVKGECRKIHNEELNHLYCSQNIW